VSLISLVQLLHFSLEMSRSRPPVLRVGTSSPTPRPARIFDKGIAGRRATAGPWSFLGGGPGAGVAIAVDLPIGLSRWRAIIRRLVILEAPMLLASV
jgi:hypothetical protein